MERAAFAIYLAVVIISPLLFGAVHVYAYSLIFFLILAASLLLAAGNIYRHGDTGRLHFRYPVTGFYFLFLAMLAFLILQVVPLPAFLVKFLSPQSYDIQAGAAALTGRRESMTLAPYTYPVRMSLMRWSVYGLFFFGLSQVVHSRRRLELLCFCILLTAALVSVYGIYQAYGGGNRIWWFSGYGGYVRGTYINRNHFAGFMSMALMLAAAYASSLSSGSAGRNEAGVASFQERIPGFLSREQLYSKRALVVFLGVVVGLGLVLSASRGGIISAALGLLLLGLFYVARRSQRRNGIIVLILFLLIGGYGLQVGIEHTIERFTPEQLQSSFEGRYRYARQTFDVFMDYPLTGTGAGNFQYAYPRYQAPEDMGMLIDYAHNDWAQLLAETGAAGFIFALAGMGMFVFFVLHRWRQRRDSRVVALGVVPLGVTTTMGVHSWFDFNMHIPANVLVLAAILAIGRGALFMQHRSAAATSDTGFRILDLDLRGLLQVVLLFLLITLGMGLGVRHFVAEMYCSTIPNSTLVRDMNPPVAEIERAVGWDRYNAAYRFKLARALDREGTGPAGNIDAITEALEQAVMLNPFSPLYYLDLGWAYTRRWQQQDFLENWLPRTDLAMELAGLYSGARDPVLHKDIGNYWLIRSRTLDPAGAAWEKAIEKAVSHFRQALQLEKGRSREKLLADIRDTVGKHSGGSEIMERVLASEE